MSDATSTELFTLEPKSVAAPIIPYAQPQYGPWTLEIANGLTLRIKLGEEPNWFHRLMVGYILGMKYIKA